MPLWSDMEPVDITSQWQDDSSLASVANRDLVQGPTIRPPGFGLPRKQWCTSNRFRTNQGHCNACHKLWSPADSDRHLCMRGANQTMSHIEESRPLTKLDGGLKKLHTADDESVDRPSSYGMINCWPALRRRLPTSSIVCLLSVLW